MGQQGLNSGQLRGNFRGDVLSLCRGPPLQGHTTLGVAPRFAVITSGIRREPAPQQAAESPAVVSHREAAEHGCAFSLTAGGAALGRASKIISLEGSAAIWDRGSCADTLSGNLGLQADGACADCAAGGGSRGSGRYIFDAMRCVPPHGDGIHHIAGFPSTGRAPPRHGAHGAGAAKSRGAADEPPQKRPHRMPLCGLDQGLGAGIPGNEGHPGGTSSRDMEIQVRSPA